MKSISILGSTGKIGIQSLEVISERPDLFKVVSLCCGKNETLLKEQQHAYGNPAISCAEKDGPESTVRAAIHPDADIVINAVVGKAGLLPTIEALKKGKTVAIANKETLVLAGALVMKTARDHGGQVIPIDSEHSALFQSMMSGKREEIKKVILTMGKGPIARMPDLSKVTMKDVLNRPKWDMGMKINVDSASCINKAFEVIEAAILYSLSPDQIDIIVHPEYLCHSLVVFRDGSIITELGTPDMKRYIRYALHHPNRADNGIIPDLTSIPLTFEKPPHQKFPCLSMGHFALAKGGTMPAVLHGADSAAVRAFIEEKIGFTQIPEIIQKTMDAHIPTKHPSLAQILQAESWAEKHAWANVEAAR